MSTKSLAWFILSLMILVMGCGLVAPTSGEGEETAVSSPEQPSSLAYETRSDGAIRLTTPPANASDQNPTFAPDGTQLIFSRFDNGYNIGPAGIFRLDLTPVTLTRLTPVEDQDNVNLPGSAWNSANNRIVFASDRAEADDLWQIAPDGSDFSRLTTHDGPPWYIEPSWSPDGVWLVFEADDDVPDDQQQGSIWKVRADGTGLTVLTDGPAEGVDDRQPNWSPTGDRILFQRHTPGSDDWDIYTMTPDGADMRRITTQPSSDTDASWSPDGRFIVYSSDFGGLPTPNIFVISANGGTPVRVTVSQTNEDGAPSWSSDGRWIAFESHLGQDEDVPASLWRIAAPPLTCPILPANNIWNTPIDTLPVHSNSAAYVNTIGATDNLHPDFGAGLWQGAPIGIPYVEVPGTQPKVNVSFTYDDESDPSPYPIPANAPIEGGPTGDGDRHVIVVDRDNCLLYELFYAWPQPDGSWAADSGAIFDLNSNALRPDGWTSADAAGLPILPGLVRYDEVANGAINHALRFTAPQTQHAYIWPARHFASDLTGTQYPPMGIRFRLKADYDISGYSADAQVILQALKTYGMILADNGSPWFLSGVPDDLWDNDVLQELKQVTGANFEAVDMSSLMVDPDSGQVFQGEPQAYLPMVIAMSH